MTAKLLEIENLHAGAAGKEIIKGISLSVNTGEVHVILGPNGLKERYIGAAMYYTRV